MSNTVEKIKLSKFVKDAKTRLSIIKKADGNALKEVSSYLPNKLAKALHPEKQFLVVTKVVEHKAANAKSFYLSADKSQGTTELAWFSAGQYLSIDLEIGNMKLTRPYSIASAPAATLGDGHYILTIKRVNGGIGSEYILDNWAEGTKVTASAPLGTFTYEPLRDAKTVIGIAGGSGITPFLSLANAIADGDEDLKLILLYGSNTLEEAIHLDELKAIEKKTDSFKLVNVLSGEEKEGCEKGFITAEIIKKYAPDGEYSVFLCGPQAMYNFVDKELLKLALRKKFIRHELFGEYFNPSKEEDYPKNVAPEFNVTVKINGETQTIKASADESILRSLEKNGIAAPAHCRSGECGWCHSHLLSGEVYTPKSIDGRREADLLYGYIHPCCAFPISDITIEVPVKK